MAMNEELSNYTFSQPPILWVPHTASSVPPYRLLASQITPCSTTQKLNGASQLGASDTASMVIQVSKRKASRKFSKPNYKHIPHKDKPPHLVARRNARERKRVQAVNSAFAKLRKCVPIENRNKRLSKVKTLHRAIEYINGLQAMLRQPEDPNSILQTTPIHYYRQRSESNTSQDFEDDDRAMDEFQEFEEYLESDEVVNKENESQGWTTMGSGCEPTYWNCVPYHEECDCTGNITS